jgi:hypothetical protein
LSLTTLRAEFLARGFNDLESSGTTRQDNYLNRAYYEICEDADWPFLEATSSGAAPLAISDLRTIESVVHTPSLTRLSPLDRRNIMEDDAVLTTTGTPYYYYLTTGTTVAVYPANTGSISVRYWKVPAALSAGADVPILPTRFHNLIVDGAVGYAYLDVDNYEAATATFDIWRASIAKMRESLLVGQHDQADDFIWASNSVDG